MGWFDRLFNEWRWRRELWRIEREAQLREQDPLIGRIRKEWTIQQLERAKSQK